MATCRPKRTGFRCTGGQVRPASRRSHRSPRAAAQAAPGLVATALALAVASARARWRGWRRLLAAAGAGGRLALRRHDLDRSQVGAERPAGCAVILEVVPAPILPVHRRSVEHRRRAAVRHVEQHLAFDRLAQAQRRAVVRPDLRRLAGHQAAGLAGRRRQVLGQDVPDRAGMAHLVPRGVVRAGDRPVQDRHPPALVEHLERIRGGVRVLADAHSVPVGVVNLRLAADRQIGVRRDRRADRQRDDQAHDHQ